MERAVTREVQVSVECFFLEHESVPDLERYSFAYKIRLKNLGHTRVQLISRHWIITDGTGEERHVHGDGVVGKQPMLEPGEEFEYMSGSLLPTPVGTMQGTYQMINDAGEVFDVQIPVFTLAVPGAFN